MFKRFKKEKPLHKKVAEIVEIQETVLNRNEEALSSIEALQDPAEKILQLHELLGESTRTEYRANRQKNAFISRRTEGAIVAGQMSGTTVGAAAVAVPAILLCPPLLPLAVLSGIIGMVPGAMATATLSEKNPKNW